MGPTEPPNAGERKEEKGEGGPTPRLAANTGRAADLVRAARDISFLIQPLRKMWDSVLGNL